MAESEERLAGKKAIWEMKGKRSQWRGEMLKEGSDNRRKSKGNTCWLKREGK